MFRLRRKQGATDEPRFVLWGARTFRDVQYCAELTRLFKLVELVRLKQKLEDGPAHWRGKDLLANQVEGEPAVDFTWGNLDLMQRYRELRVADILEGAPVPFFGRRHRVDPVGAIPLREEVAASGGLRR